MSFAATQTLDWLHSGVRQSPKGIAGIDRRLRQIPCFGRNRIFLLALDEVEFVHSDIGGVQIVGNQRQGTTKLRLSARR